jgi:two-component system sensor histidine kinase QseC
MKLATKYNRVSITATILVVLVSSFCYYFIIRYALINQLDDDLKIEEQEVMDYLQVHHVLPHPSNYKDQQVLFQPLNNNIVKRQFSSVYKYDNGENAPVRQLVFPVTADGKNYEVIISKSQQETETLIQLVLLITSGIVILLVLMLLIINRVLFKKLWYPFNSTLRELKQFNPSAKNDLALQNTSINEFAELNQAVKIMANRVKRDYDALKIFTENASHEMQTPLAIINSKLDILIQDETINAHQMRQLQVIYDTLSKLSRLVQSLLILTKIENQQFNETEDIQLDTLIQSKLQQFEEFVQSKNLTINTDINPSFIQGNKYLVDILFSNLFTNAIRYNKQNGTILINVNSGQFIISNSSNLHELDQQNIFQRFYRHSDTKEEGNGLGLSIIKQICDVSGYTVSYKYQNGLHIFSINFQA